MVLLAVEVVGNSVVVAIVVLALEESPPVLLLLSASLEEDELGSRVEVRGAVVVGMYGPIGHRPSG